MNQPLFWSLAILGLFIWLVFRPFATAPWKIMGAFGLLVLAHPITMAALRASDRAYPLKYDYVLQAIDVAIGITAFQVARLFTPLDRTVLYAVYDLMSAAMISWYGVHVVMRGGEPRKLLYTYFILFIVGASLYGVVPALGPRYAFSDTFPMGNPQATGRPAALAGFPNAMPSLHLATAVALVLFNKRNRSLLWLSLAFLVGTIAATLAFEHYVIDLVVGVPFACFAVELAYGRLVLSASYLGFVLVWLGLIRFDSAGLVGHPWLLRFMTVFTVSLGIRSVLLRWRENPQERASELETVVMGTEC